jgi:hypothetical protein
MEHQRSAQNVQMMCMQNIPEIYLRGSSSPNAAPHVRGRGTLGKCRKMAPENLPESNQKYSQ